MVWERGRDSILALEFRQCGLSPRNLGENGRRMAWLRNDLANHLAVDQRQTFAATQVREAQRVLFQAKLV